jgi:hypothetical protein
MLELPAVGTRDRQSRTQSVATGTHSEEIHIRNFDDNQTYDLTLSVHMDGESVLTSTYQLTPGRRISEIYRLPAGVYDVEVRLDGDQIETARCEIGSVPERTALIEVGNGTVSVTQGLY